MLQRQDSLQSRSTPAGSKTGRNTINSRKRREEQALQEALQPPASDSPGLFKMPAFKMPDAWTTGDDPDFNL